MNEAIILVGSNINPQENIRDCLIYLTDCLNGLTRSRIWKTKSSGSEGQDFLNLAIKANTTLDERQLKISVLQKIEDQLKRVRLSNKNAPRTIDLDIIIFNNKVIDTDLWVKGFMAIPVAELMPSLCHPGSTKKLKVIAEELKSSEQAELFIPPEGLFPY